MFNVVKYIILESRPLQWIKNLSVFVYLIFTKNFFHADKFLVVFYTFCAFTLLTSSVYIINDILDYESDKENPEKKSRPIAAGKISKRTGLIFAALFFLIGLYWSFYIAESLVVIYVFYFILMISYSLYLKNLAIIDALVIAGGFVIRVIAGAFVIGIFEKTTTEIYSWIIIVTISVSLLLAFGKRRSELTLLGIKSQHIRPVLLKYPKELLNSLISALVATTFLSYILLTFQTDSVTASRLIDLTSLKIPDPVYIVSKSSHLLKLTIPLVFYGIARYLYIIYKKKTGGTPEKALFDDKPMLVTLTVWIILLFVLLYIQ